MLRGFFFGDAWRFDHLCKEVLRVVSRSRFCVARLNSSGSFLAIAEGDKPGRQRCFSQARLGGEAPSPSPTTTRCRTVAATEQALEMP